PDVNLHRDFNPEKDFPAPSLSHSCRQRAGNLRIALGPVAGCRRLMKDELFRRNAERCRNSVYRASSHPLALFSILHGLLRAGAPAPRALLASPALRIRGEVRDASAIG